ncbi:MAG: hypothetical protein K2N28_00740 [Muribaculaceae bacterium]|nr:hypothetical protein [Muribaculaceae bacterium]
MKQIYLVLCALLAVVLFVIIIYGDYRKKSVTVPAVHETVTKPCQSDSCINPRYISYSKFQPGLLGIADQMVKEYVNKQENDWILEVYPILLDFTMLEQDQNTIATDTFKYNWKNDIILYINNIDVAYACHKCELISSQDSVRALQMFHKIELDRSIRTELKDNHKYLNAIKNWNKTVLDSICISNASICSSHYYYVCRLIIKNGKLVDARYIRCKHIDTGNPLIRNI